MIDVYKSEISSRLEELSLLLDVNTLPAIKLVPVETYIPHKTSLPAVNHEILHEGQVVGRCNIKSDNEFKWFNGIVIDHRGEGFGPATYALTILESISDGYSFRNDHWISPEAKHRWEVLAASGVARTVKEFKRISPRYYEGRYIVEASVA